MDIHQVVGTLVCTQRVTGLHHVSLRVLRDGTGKLNVATDPVGARRGNWVFTTSGSAARLAMGDTRILTDLTIGGIIDHWDVPETETETESRTEAGAGDQRPADAA